MQEPQGHLETQGLGGGDLELAFVKRRGDGSRCDSRNSQDSQLSLGQQRVVMEESKVT